LTMADGAKQERHADGSAVLTDASKNIQELNKFGDLTKATSAKGEVTTINYDSSRNITEVQGPIGHLTKNADGTWSGLDG
ncbi:hypothetical protein ABTK00_22130, partial [Acinetobacter baumannii]